MGNPEKVCLVCHEEAELFAIGKCDHPICFKCSTRMRALCEQFYCPICRTDLPEVFFMEKLEKFGDMPVRKFISNKKLRVQFENEKVRLKFEELLEHRCNLCKGRPPDRSFKALRDHMRRQHTLFYCDLCVELKLFTSERKVYNRQDLASHRRMGDKDDTSYKGHPLCEFCDQRYLDKDELYKHLRKDHFYCHFCDVHGSQDYFNDYDVLREHFRSQHFLCEEGECVDMKFENAFRSLIDLKSHRAKEHSKNLSKQQVKQERTINIDINLPPRTKPGRGRGGVSRDDYEGGRRYDNRGGRGGERHREDRDLERAMQASLSTMKEETMKKVKQASEKQDPGVKPKEDSEYKPTADSFPVLGADVSSGATTVNSSEVSSLAERFAMANMLPMNYNAQPNSLNDFPTLLQDTRPRSPMNSNVAPKPVQGPASGKRFKAAVNGTRTEEDFPSLSSGKSSAKVQPSGAWVKPGDNPYTGDTKTTSKVRKSNTTKQMKSKTISDTNNLFHKVYDDADFPTLALKSGNNSSSGWTQIGKTSSSVHRDKVDNKKSNNISDSAQSKDENQLDIQSVIDRFSPVNVVSDSPDKKQKPKTQKKKKKEKDKVTDIVNKPAAKVKSEGTLRENSSLDNIASLLLGSSEQVSAGTEIVSDVETEKENKFHNTKSSPIPMKESRKECDLLSHTNTIDTADSEQLVIPEPATVKFMIEESEFPSLGASSKVKKPPPGFLKSNEEKSNAPPGFSKPSSGSKPPPGFKAGPAKADTDLSEYSLTNAMPLSASLADFENFKYSQPSDFSERNRQLIGDINAMLADEPSKFIEFKTLSGEFRKRDIDAHAYFIGCEDILGKDNFAMIFPELLSLLPDIDRQNELLGVFMKQEGMKKDMKDNVINISKKSRNAKGAWTATQSGFLTCQTCRQVLIRKDYNSHVSQHSLDSDFPSLGMGPAPVSSGSAFGSWVKAK